ncbi:MAG: redoxin domain-containing protein [Cellulosilyticum sp.]|nr:redoxin domain-containing protein [Cellulosilyticum sp.]
MEHLNLWLVGLEGIVSFLSPCILPLLPVYLSILANSMTEHTEGLIKNTLGFVLGISSTFFLLGMSVYTVGSFFSDYQILLTLIGGVIIVVMGLFYMGVIQSNVLNKDRRFQMKTGQMNIVSSFILGLTFSFGWTPCIGPTLASVLVMASTSSNRSTALFLILIYTIGFTMPFMILAIFYKKLVRYIDRIKNHMLLIKRMGGVILIIAGIGMMITSGQGIIGNQRALNQQNSEQATPETEIESSSDIQEEEKKLQAIDFELNDQYGNLHKLSDYRGKVVFLNFWATWCPPCVGEMPYIEELYEEYGYNEEEVVILGIANPNLGSEVSQESIVTFLEEEGYTFPVVFDLDYEQIYTYGFNSFPSTLIIDKEGYIKLYVPGAMNKQTMEQIIEEAK